MPVTPGAMAELTAKVSTTGQGGIVFDYQGPRYYKCGARSARGKQALVGNVTEGGTVIAKRYAANLWSGRDYTLGVTLRGGLVNVSLDGFFFQAEDGIRDGRVTGVQTCALPI